MANQLLINRRMFNCPHLNNLISQLRGDEQQQCGRTKLPELFGVFVSNLVNYEHVAQTYQSRLLPPDKI